MGEYETAPSTLAPTQGTQLAAPQPKPKLFGSQAVDGTGAGSELERVWDPQTATFKTTKPKQQAQDPYEQRREQFKNASYAAMNAQLKVFAAELDAAGQQLLLDLARIKADQKADEKALAAYHMHFVEKLRHLTYLAQDIGEQLHVLGTPKGEVRLTDGAEVLRAALDEFQPVYDDIDAWMTANTDSGASSELIVRANGLVAFVFMGVVPNAQTGKRADTHAAKDSAIEKHLDAAIVAAQCGFDERAIGYLDEMVLHAKAATALLEGHARVEGQLESRIKELTDLVDKINDKEGWTTRRLNEAVDPLRNVK
jgi:hypothetical protein